MLNFELATDGTWSTQLTESNAAQGLEITVTLPSGLYYVKDNGNLNGATVKVKAQYRQADGAWQDWNEYHYGSEKHGSLSVYRMDNPPTAQYEVRICRTYKSGTSTRYSTRIYWTQLSSIIYDDFARPGRVLIGIKALATDQPSASMPTVTWLQSRNTVNVFNPHTQQYEQKPAYNPACLL